MHPEKFFFEGLKEQLNMPQSNESVINTYYGNMLMRCVPILDFLNNRYMELNQQIPEADALFDNLNKLYKFHSSPISFVYNSLIYYNKKIENSNLNNLASLNSSQQLDMISRLKKKRLFLILTGKKIVQKSTWGI